MRPSTYLDYNATQPIKPAVRDAMIDVLAGPTNASSVHRLGQRARGLVEQARAGIAALIGARPGEKLHEELFNSYERPRATDAEKILLAEREPLAVEAVESMFAEIGLLVLEGDAAGLAAKVSELSAARLEPQANGAAAPSRLGAPPPGRGHRLARAELGEDAPAERPGTPAPLIHSDQ